MGYPPIMQPNLRFWRREDLTFVDEVWGQLLQGYLEFSDLKAFERNVLLGKFRYKEHTRVLANHLHTYKNQVISESGGIPVFRDGPVGNPSSFESAIEQCFNQHKTEKIGVHLSGGVDSSLIIGALKLIGIPYTLVGVSTERFEFRTERYVQEVLLNECGSGKLLDFEANLPFSDCSDVPPHQIPELGSLSYGATVKLADEAQRLGVTLLLSGSGGDLLLGGDASESSCPWKISMFDDWFAQDLVYSTRGIVCRSFFSDPLIAGAIWNLRKGQKEDLRKCWARHHFREYLPKELVNYTYKADFWGVYMDGLEQNKESLVALEEEAYELSGMEYFRTNSIKPLLKGRNTECEMDLNQRIEARAAAAAWVVSLKRLTSEAITKMAA